MPFWLQDIIYIFTSSEIQRELFPAKVVFIFFSIVFFIAIIYFMLNSSYLKHQFIVDFASFFSWQPASVQRILKRWKRIQKRMDSGVEHEYKLAVIEADDLLMDVLEDKGFEGETFEEVIKKVAKISIPNLDEIMEAHKVRNLIVHDPNYKLDIDRAKHLLDIYERGIKNIESF